MRDIGPGCEAEVQQLERWTNALMAKDFDVLEDVLHPEFQFTVDPKYAGGRLRKAGFIAFDRKIKECSIDLLSVTARKMGDQMITTLVMAELTEEFEGDLGPDMPSAAEMKDVMTGARMAYGSGWKKGDDGEWQCFSHHIFGFIE